MSKEGERSGHRNTGSLARDFDALHRSEAFRGPVAPLEDHEQSSEHLALIYESRDEQFDAVVPFVRQGLDRNERCLYVADENSRGEVLEALRDGGVDVDTALESGALSVLTVHETYLRDGTFDVDDSIALLEDALREGTTDFDGFRVTVEETWLLRADAAEDFMTLEARVNELFRDEDCVALCQYNRRKFPPDVIRDVIHTHPYLVHDATVEQNDYYAPPDEFLGPERPATEVDRKLEALHDRAETKRDHQRVVEALEAAREGISLLDENGEFIYVNDAYADTFGYEPEAMIGEHWDALGIEADPDYVYDQVLPTIEREGQWTGTTTCVRSDGETFLGQHSLTQTEDDELICVVRDVTEREERKQDLELFRNLIDQSNDAVFVIDPETGRYLDANEKACRNRGYTREELLELSVPDVVVGHRDEESWRASVERLREEGEVTVDGKHRRKDGTTFPAETNLTYVERNRDYVLAVTRDVTERKARERALRRLYEIAADPDMQFGEKLDALFELGCDRFDLEYGGLARIDPEADWLEIQAVSGDHEHLGQGTEATLSDTHCRLVTGERGTVSVADSSDAGLADTTSYTRYGVDAYLGTRIPLDDGLDATLYFFSTEPRDSPFTDAEHTFHHLMGQWIKYELEHQRYRQDLEETVGHLRQSNDRLKQFAYAASHDLQEPLRMVSSYLQLLESEYANDLDKEAREYIDFAVDGADRMRTMVDDLLAYSRVEQSDGAFEPVECEAIVDRVTDDLRVQIEETGAEIVVGSLPTVRADREQLNQLFSNLVSNAIKYNEEETPRVEITAERRENRWEFAVSDNGIGVDPEKADRIFEVFKRLHHDDEYSGTGIGLSLCQEIVENHGGNIWLESEPGNGTTFYFSLPGADAE